MFRFLATFKTQPRGWSCVCTATVTCTDVRGQQFAQQTIRQASDCICHRQMSLTSLSRGMYSRILPGFTPLSTEVLPAVLPDPQVFYIFSKTGLRLVQDIIRPKVTQSYKYYYVRKESKHVDIMTLYMDLFLLHQGSSQ